MSAELLTVLSFRKAWQDGFAPQFSTQTLEALARALGSDDLRIIQGATTAPAPLPCVYDWPCEAADPIGFCLMAERVATVGEVVEFFAQACFRADMAMGEPAGCRWLLNPWDESPRATARMMLLAEVIRTIKERTNGTKTGQDGSQTE